MRHVPLAELPIFRIEEQAEITAANLRAIRRVNETIRLLFELHPIQKIGFLTLTFPKPLFVTREAMRRLNIFFNSLRKTVEGYISVRERHNNGAIHFHVIVLCKDDIATGSDLKGLKNARNEAAEVKKLYLSKRASILWEKFETAARTHGFGRIEFTPVYSNGEAVANYVSDSAKQTWIFGRKSETRRSRFWSCSKNLKRVSGYFTTLKSQFRRYFADFATACGFPDEVEFLETMGKYWAFYARQWIETGRLSALLVLPRKLRPTVAQRQIELRIPDPLLRLNRRVATA